jgi:hypothetical protein
MCRVADQQQPFAVAPLGTSYRPEQALGMRLELRGQVRDQRRASTARAKNARACAPVPKASKPCGLRAQNRVAVKASALKRSA